MRKFFAGVLVGFLLSVPTFAIAQQISMIGKEVQSEFPIIVNGETLPVKAIGIEGTSYAPLRAVGEISGYQVDFKDRTVIFTSVSSIEQGEEGESVTTITEEQDVKVDHGYTLETINEAIKKKEEAIEEHTKLLEYSLERFGPSPDTDKAKAAIEQAKEELEKLKQIKAELEAQAQQQK